MTNEDRLQAAALKMIAEANEGRSVIPILRKVCPYVERQIVADGKQDRLLSLWGRSSNVDENSRQVIVHSSILQGIGELAGVPMRGKFVHAGLAHTYGYLFSIIDTPYGRKRDRWVSDDLENGFGIGASLLSDRPKHGTLLGNLTQFLGRIAFRGTPGSRTLDRYIETAAAEVIRYEFGGLKTQRIVEEVVVPGGVSPAIRILTDLIPFPNPPHADKKETALLVYSIQRCPGATPKLITAFPISSRTATELMPTHSPRVEVELRLRFNAYVPGLYGRSLQGRRFLESPVR